MRTPTKSRFVKAFTLKPPNDKINSLINRGNPFFLGDALFGVWTSAEFRSRLMFITRLVFTIALSLTGLAALAGFSPLHLIANAMAQSASDVAKAVSLPEMALGPANASITITEYASMTCSHCAAFNANVFPKIKSEYIDTGKVRYVFREFSLDSKAAVASMLARCIAKDDAGKYFAVIDMMFKKLDEWSLPADPLQGFLRVFATSA
jgi:hypothetical protein